MAWFYRIVSWKITFVSAQYINHNDQPNTHITLFCCVRFGEDPLIFLFKCSNGLGNINLLSSGLLDPAGAVQQISLIGALACSTGCEEKNGPPWHICLFYYSFLSISWNLQLWAGKTKQK